MLSYFSKKLVCFSSICDNDCIDDVAFCEFEDEVLDGVVFQNQPALHSKFYDDSYEVNTNQHFDCEDASASYGLVSEF